MGNISTMHDECTIVETTRESITVLTDRYLVYQATLHYETDQSESHAD